MLREVLFISLIAAIGCHGGAWATPPAHGAHRPATISEHDLEPSLTEIADLGRRLRPLLDRSQFDLEVLIEALDYDPERIARFVSDEISVEIYPGALRGAAGTLISRSGNALDQALLLATLLNEAEVEAVIRRGKLSKNDAATLVEMMASPRPTAPSIWWPHSESNTSPGVSLSDADLQQFASVRTDPATADRITTAPASIGVRCGDLEARARIQAEAEDYYWVDYRTAPGAAWRSVHPALGEDPGIDIIDTYVDEVPRRLTHQVLLEVLVEQRVGTRIEQSPLVKPFELTSADLIGFPVTFELVPDPLLDPEGPLDPKMLADDTRFLVPMVDGKLPQGARALSLRGLLVPTNPLGTGVDGALATWSEKKAMAADISPTSGRARSDDSSGVAIESLRLRVTFLSPDGSTRTAETEIFAAQRDLDRNIQDDEDRRRALVAALARSYSMVFATGSYSPGFLLDSLLTQFESLASLQRISESLSPQSCNTVGCLARMERAARDTVAGMAMLSQAFDEAFDEQHDRVTYRHTPNLTAMSHSLLPDPGRKLARIDLISSTSRALVDCSERLQQAPVERVLIAGSRNLIDRPGRTRVEVAR